MATKTLTITFIFLFLSIIGNYAKGQTIQVLIVQPKILCAGGSVDVSFKADGFKDPTNTFTALLSNKNGDFSNAIVIGTSTYLNISNMLPRTLSEGINYKIKVVSSKPVISQEFPTQITIQAKLAFNLSSENIPNVPWNKKVFYLTSADSIKYKLNGTDASTYWNFKDGEPNSYIGAVPPIIKYINPGKKIIWVSRTDRACTHPDTSSANGYDIEVFSCKPILPPQAILIADSNKRLIESPTSKGHFVLCRDAPLSTVTSMAKVNLYLETGSNFYMKGNTLNSVIYDTDEASANIVAGARNRYKESVIVRGKKSSLSFLPASLKDSFAVLTCPRVEVDYTNYKCLIGNLCDTFDEFSLDIRGKDTVCVGESAEYSTGLYDESIRWQTSDLGILTKLDLNKVRVLWQKPGTTTVNFFVRLRYCDYDFIVKKRVFVRDVNGGGCITGTDNSNVDLVSVNPNPVTNMLNVNASADVEYIRVMDVLGKIIIDKSESLDAIDMSKMARGLYLMLVHMKNSEEKLFRIEKN